MSLHLEAKQGDYAEIVLLPGDPLRAKYFAETFLENPVCVNKVRGMYGFTGSYHGKKVSVQGSGMGMPSAAIYIQELIFDYNVKKIIRVGTCGSLQKNHLLGQVILSMSASGDSSVNRTYFNQMDFAPTADFDLLKKAYDSAKKLNIPTLVGPVFSSDRFYDYPAESDRWGKWSEHGILAVDMETQLLYTLAARFGISALSILTISDNIITGKGATQEEREKSYSDMMKIALELA